MRLLKHFRDRLGFTYAKEKREEATAKAENAVKSVEELADSQQGLKSAIRDTGFFLGDALLMERSENERSRASASGHQHQ